MYKSQFQKTDPYDWFCGPESHFCVIMYSLLTEQNNNNTGKHTKIVYMLSFSLSFSYFPLCNLLVTDVICTSNKSQQIQHDLNVSVNTEPGSGSTQCILWWGNKFCSYGWKPPVLPTVTNRNKNKIRARHPYTSFFSYLNWKERHLTKML